MEFVFLSHVLQPFRPLPLDRPLFIPPGDWAKDDCVTVFLFEYTEESTGRRQQTTAGALSHAPSHSQQSRFGWQARFRPRLLKLLAEALPLPYPMTSLTDDPSRALQVYFDTISTVTGRTGAVIGVMPRRGARIAT